MNEDICGGLAYAVFNSIKSLSVIGYPVNGHWLVVLKCFKISCFSNMYLNVY